MWHNNYKSKTLIGIFGSLLVNLKRKLVWGKMWSRVRFFFVC